MLLQINKSLFQNFPFHLVKFSSKKNLCYKTSFRTLHNTAVISASNISTSDSLGLNNRILSSIPLSTADEKLLSSGLSELRDHTQQKSVFEFLPEFKINSDKKLPYCFTSKQQILENQSIKDFTQDTVTELSKKESSMKNIFQTLNSMKGNYFTDKYLNYYSLYHNKPSSPSEADVLSISTSTNQNIIEMMPSKSKSGLQEINPEGQIIIDPQKLKENLKWIEENILYKIHDIDLNSLPYLIYGMSNLLAYRSIIHIYDRTQKVDLNSLSSDKNKIEALKIMQKNRLIFTSVGALGVLIGLNSIMYFQRNYMPKTIDLNVSVNTTPESNQSDYSFVFFAQKYFKTLNKKLKLFIIFILFPLFIFISYPFLSYVYLSYVIFLNSNIFYFKLLVCLLDILAISYNIFVLYLINKYSKLNDKPRLSKYIPSFINNELSSAYKISRYCEHDKLIIIGIFYKTIFYYILILLFVLATLLI